MKNKILIGICIIFLLIVSIAYAAYNEKITKPSITDNDYAIAVSNFIKEKCGNCKDVMIIGDDFVVPQYRRDISMFEGFLWWKDIKSKNIYTDQAYIKNSFKPLSEIEDLFKKKQDVKIIIDPALQSSLYGKVEELKDLISSKYLSSVEIIDPNTVACNSFSKLDDATLIIIGGEENSLIRCHPFIPKEEDSYLSLSPNIWDIEHYSILLNPTPVDNKYDNLLALYNIILNGPEPDWNFNDVVVACLWDGKFGGSVPVAQEITCNMIPLVELAPDIRDSWNCRKYIPPFFVIENLLLGGETEVVDTFVCQVVHFATAYDLATWGAAIFTAGATGVGGEVFDGGIAILKVGVKNYLPAIAKSVGSKVMKDSIQTIMLAPNLLKSVVELVVRAPSKLADMIEGSIQILKHGPEVAESAFEYIKGIDLSNIDKKILSKVLAGVADYKKFNKEVIEVDISDIKPYVDEKELDIIYKFFKEGEFKLSMESQMDSLKLRNLVDGTDAKLNIKIKQDIGDSPAHYIFKDGKGIVEIKPLPDKNIKRYYALMHPNEEIRKNADEISELSDENFVKYFNNKNFDGEFKFFEMHSHQIDSLKHTYLPHEMVHHKIAKMKGFKPDSELIGIPESESIRYLYYFEEGLDHSFSLKSLKGTDNINYKAGFDSTAINDHTFFLLKNGDWNPQGIKSVSERLDKVFFSSYDLSPIAYIAHQRALAKKLDQPQKVLDDYDKLIKQKLSDHGFGHFPFEDIEETTKIFETEYDNAIKILDKSTFNTVDETLYKDILLRIYNRVKAMDKIILI